MNKTELINLFNNSFNEFLDILIEKFPKEQDFILINILLNTQRLKHSDIMLNLSNILIPNKQLILDKSPDFFIHKVSHMFYGINEHINPSNSFKRIWNHLQDEEREMMWKWFKLFLNICSEYYKD